MATITLSLTGMIDGTSQTVTSSGTINDTDLPNFFAAYRDKFVMPGSTDAQTFKVFAKGVADMSATDVYNYLVKLTSRQASLQVNPVVVTPVP